MVEIGGATVGSGYDRLTVAGIATLNGTLDVSLIGGFEPQVGQTFVILTCSLRSGEFNQVMGMDAGAGKAFQVQYNSGNVTLAVVASASGDMNCDGAFNLLDAAPFALALTDLDAFAAQFPGAIHLRAT
ncbi:MAG: hypothetical protein IPK83_17235 [Planctomycetes bacterium]|nr:hypothetical protein [Planctomycetota bacterium]